MENPPRVLGVLSGADMDSSLLWRWAKSADVVYAADGGANRLMLRNDCPVIIVGDMDSVSERTLEAATRKVHLPDQDTTDCDKLLQLAAADRHRSITLTSVEGDLPDHVLATLHSAARSKLDVRFAFRRGIGYIVKPSTARLISTKPGGRVSLLPLTACRGTTLLGVHWPLDSVRLEINGLTSISNRAEGNEVAASVEGGAAMLFVEFADSEMPCWQ